MTLPLTICAICGERFKARTSYGLCKNCYSRDRLREWDRLQSAIKYAQRDNLSVSLSLVQWLSTISDFRGCCAYCEQPSYSIIDMVSTIAGLVWSNVVPACRSCAQIKRVGWENTYARVTMYLTANMDRTETDANLEYFNETPDGPDLIAPVETPHD